LRKKGEKKKQLRELVVSAIVRKKISEERELKFCFWFCAPMESCGAHGFFGDKQEQTWSEKLSFHCSGNHQHSNK